MARTARKPKDDAAEEVQVKDPALAKKLYFHDIKPARSKASEHMQEVSTAMKAVKKQCHFQTSAFVSATRAHELEDAKKDDWLRGFVMILNELEGRTVLTFHSNDLVDIAQAAADQRPKPSLGLVTLGQPSDGMETDLADAAEDEADDEELAQQEGRGASGD